MAHEICPFANKSMLTFMEAKRLVNGAKLSGKSSGNVPKRWYYCVKCQTYHVTHYKSDKRRKKRIRWIRGGGKC